MENNERLMCGKHVRISAEAQGRRLRRQWNHSFAGTVEKEEHKNSGKIGPDRKPVETQNQTGEQ